MTGKDPELRLSTWVEQPRTADPIRRASQYASFDGEVLAYERIGALTSEEARRWRERFDHDDDTMVDFGAELGPDARTRGEAYIRALISRVPVQTRDLDPAAEAIRAECDRAIRTLQHVGVFDDERTSHWRTELLRARSPWVDESLTVPAHGFVFAFGPPPGADDEEANDPAPAEPEPRPEANEVRRVIRGSEERDGGIAIVALVVHEDATSVHFHYLPPSGIEALSGDPLRRDFEASSAELQRLLPAPRFEDDRGQTYTAVARPLGVYGTGERPDAGSTSAHTGSWLYTPAAAPDAQEFTITTASRTWTLRAT